MGKQAPLWGIPSIIIQSLGAFAGLELKLRTRQMGLSQGVSIWRTQQMFSLSAGVTYSELKIIIQPNNQNDLIDKLQPIQIQLLLPHKMGVSKLWDILLTIAVQKNIEDLSGLILAIDASLWIVKVNSIFENVDEGLKCIFNKLLWLKKNNIRPIFVFDGETPALKRKTLQERRNRRKEINTFDIAKKVEIEIVKTVSGVATQRSEQATSYDQKSKEIDQMLANLLKYQNSTNTIELSEKMALQAQVLNKKYELYCDMYPKLQQRFGEIQYFSGLDIQSKEQILENVVNNGLPSARDIREMKQKMSQQEKIMYEMEFIKKKSKIRELQDNLYRKVMTKKIQNGYEIIEGVYNGKKVIQKRRLKQKSFDQWALPVSKKETCNNFKQIFRKNKNNDEQNESKGQQEDNQPNFFSKIFNKDYKVQNRAPSQSTFFEISQRLSQSLSQETGNIHNYKPKNFKPQKHKVQVEDQQQLYDDNIFDVQPKGQSQKQQTQKMNEDPDNFPQFIMVQSLDELCTSNQNIHLQNMLQILGINYIVAPFQAEAQCAALQQMGLVDGVVTEDSDVFLFGARKVYRGVFQDNIKLYSMRKVEEKLLLTREKLIMFGLMLGSDYTDGVKGIGIVNAMEILKVHHDIESLEKFTNWAKNADILQENEQNKTDYILRSAMNEDEIEFYKLHRKFKNYWHVHPGFPQKNIYNAYMTPAVQEGPQLQKRVQQTKSVQMEALKKLMEQKFKMVPLQIEMNIKILTRKFEKKSQTQITDFTHGMFARIASKRLQKAINIRDINN